MNSSTTRGRPTARTGRKKRDPPPIPKKRTPRRDPIIPKTKIINIKNKKNEKRKKIKRKYKRHQNQLRILQQNIAGWRTRELEILKRLADLKIDVAAIQEANFPIRRFGRELCHEIPVIKGWHIIAQERKTGKRTGSDSAGRGGVAWLVREGVHYDEITTSPMLPNDNTTEWCGIRVYQEAGGKVTGDVNLWNIYVLPIRESSKDDDRWQNFATANFPNTLENFIFSDANCHGTWDTTMDANWMADEWEDWMIRNNFSYMNTPDSYTRSDSKGLKSSPDITVAHNSWLGKYTWQPLYKNPGGSDHIPILVTVNLKKSNRSSKKAEKRNYRRARWSIKKANWEQFNYFLDAELEKWPSDKNKWTVQQQSLELTKAIQKAATKSIPRGNFQNPKPFWNKEISDAHKKCNATRADAHLSAEKSNEYKDARNNLYEVTRKAKEEKWRNYVSTLDSRTSSSKVWKTIAAMDGRKAKNKSGTSIRNGGKTATTDQEKADMFIQSYQKESRITKNKWEDKPVIHAQRRAVSTKCKNCDNNQTGMCCPFNNTELETAMQKLKQGKSPGMDNITNEMIQHLTPTGKEVLLKLFNDTWEQKSCPKEWKQAEIRTLPKPGKDHSKPTGYRPISLLSCISKLME